MIQEKILFHLETLEKVVSQAVSLRVFVDVVQERVEEERKAKMLAGSVGSQDFPKVEIVAAL